MKTIKLNQFAYHDDEGRLQSFETLEAKGNYYTNGNQSDYDLWKQFKGTQVTLQNKMKSENDLVKFFGLQPCEILNTVYKREQMYGGAEEGGWYYHILYTDFAETVNMETVNETDSYGNGFVTRKEFFFGQNTDTERQYYY